MRPEVVPDDPRVKRVIKVNIADVAAAKARVAIAKRLGKPIDPLVQKIADLRP